MSLSGSMPGPTRILLACCATPSTTLSKMSLLDVQPRARAAALAVIEEDGAGRAGNGGVQIGVVENDVGRFAAQFERDLLQIARGGLHDQLAHFGRAGERDLIDVRMRGQRGAGGFAETRHDIHHAVGNAGFLNQFAQAQRGERRLLGGLQHHGAAGRQRRAELPGGHQQREIPGNDLADHADRLAQRVGQKLRRLAAEIGIVLPSILVAQPAM